MIVATQESLEGVPDGSFVLHQQDALAAERFRLSFHVAAL
jgi:hypothetical protein